MFTAVQIRLQQRKGQKALGRGNYQQAIELFEQLPQDQSPEQTNRYLGMAYMGAGKYKQAEKCLSDNLERFGVDYTRTRMLADLYYAWGKREPARTYYKEALEEGEGKAERLIERRIQNTEDDESFEAVREADRAYRAGTEAFQERRFEDALSYFKQATGSDPSHVLAWNNMGAVLLNYYKDYDSAERAFKTALDYEPLAIVQGNLQRLAMARKMAQAKRKRIHLFRRRSE